MNHRPAGEDALDEAVAAYRDAGVPELPEGLAARTAALLAARDVRPADPKIQWRRRMIRNLSVGTAAAMFLSLGALLWFGAPSPANELNKAIKKAAEATTVRAVSKTTYVKGEHKGEMEMKVWSNGTIARVEIPAQSIVTVLDGNTRKGILLNSKDNTYSPIDLSNRMEEGFEKDVASVAKSLGMLKDKPIDSTTEETLNGVKTRVYTLKDIQIASLKMTMDCKIWIDPKTDLPVKQEMSMRNDEMTVNSVTEFLGFDEKLEPDLFKMAAPEGYKETELKTGK